MMVYIASKYTTHKEFNKRIFIELLENGFEAFLPASINIDAISHEEMIEVAERCFKEISNCDAMVVVCPFGKSVSSEMGYAISLKHHMLKKIHIIVLHYDVDYEVYKEAMIAPYIDKSVDSISQLIGYLKSIENCSSL